MGSRRVIVTGGGSGIGYSTVIALLEDGAQVAVLDIQTSAFEEDPRVSTHTCDVSDEASVTAAFGAALEALGGVVDAVVHSAGIMREQGGDIRAMTLDAWSRVIAVNLTGSFLVARETVRAMAGRGGALILVGSGAGTTGPSGSIPYGASKGGVNGLAITLAEHLQPLGIRVHNFMPGLVDTPLVQASLDEAISNGGVASSINAARSNANSPGGVGRVIAFMAGEHGSAIRGGVSSW